ncbi:hypothetical protein P4310_29685 [Bacillus thuringiensis]|nr:hypothetical protein [Bacillus thuringiensis]
MLLRTRAAALSLGQYEKKTVFDIMGVHYEYSIAREQKKAA